MNNSNEMNLDMLEKVTGGQYDPDVVFNKSQAVCGGNLYDLNNLRLAVGSIQPGQDIEVHPEFEYQIDGKVFFTVTEPQVIGTFVNVRINDSLEYDLLGEMEGEAL